MCLTGSNNNQTPALAKELAEVFVAAALFAK